MNSMVVVFAQEPLPQTWTKSLFLAGPTPRVDDAVSWRAAALELLYKMGYDGVVFVPEPRSGSFESLDYKKQIEWEHTCLNAADRILFWVPRDMVDMPGLTTNDEFGKWKDSKKVIFGAPPAAEKVRYQQQYCADNGIPSYTNLYVALSKAVEELNAGAVLRTGGERLIPMDVYSHPATQDWLNAQLRCFNRVDNAKVLWTHGKHGAPFCFSLWVDVFVSKEGRHKDNEFIVGRTPISACVAHYTGDTGATEILMVREFRSPVANKECMVCELPGGSSKTPQDAVNTIIEEMHEEASLKIDESRLVYHGAKQLASTMLIHVCHLYSYQMTKAEYDIIKDLEASGITTGVLSESEICYPSMMPVQDVVSSGVVDFSTIGMIHAALMG